MVNFQKDKLMSSTLSIADKIPLRFRPIAKETDATLRLAIPLILTQLAHISLGTTDVIMMGWLGPEALAAGALGSHFYYLVFYFVLGVLLAVAPILSQHLGARRFREVRRVMRHGVFVAAILAVPAILFILQADTVLVLAGQKSNLAASAQSYLSFVIIGLFPGFLFALLSEFLSAHQRPRAVLVVTVFAISFNALADYALMFGNFGFPVLGLDGAGIATAASSCIMFAALGLFVLTDQRLRRYKLYIRFWRINWAQISEIIRLGFPIAITEVAEIGMFFAAALLMGLIGTSTLAAHAVVAQSCAVSFMVPFGISIAASVRVGRATGARDPEAAVRAGWVAVAIGIAYSLVPASVFWFLGEDLVQLFFAAEGDKASLILAIGLLAIAAPFQFVDGIQVITRGALQGLKDTTGPMLVALSCYWLLGLPLAALLGLYFAMGGQGVWIGLALGLAADALLLAWRFHVKSKA